MLLGNLFPFAGQLGLSIAVQTSVIMLMYLCKISTDDVLREDELMRTSPRLHTETATVYIPLGRGRLAREWRHA